MGSGRATNNGCLQKRGDPEAEKKTTQKTAQKTTQKILEFLAIEPEASRVRIAEQLGDITEDGVKYQLSKLKRQGLIQRVGPANGGHWEVLK